MAERSMSVLCVEDDAISRKVLCTVIGKHFPMMGVIEAADGDEGLELYRTHRPDMVVTDVRMPGMDGIRLATEIRAINPQAPIIVISAHSDTHYLLDAIEIGISRYVVKPVNKEKLVNAITDCLERLALERLVADQFEQIRRLNRELELKVAERTDELANVNRELRRTNLELESANRQLTSRKDALEYANRQLESFCYSISHDLRAPLRSISGFSQIIMEDYRGRLNETADRYLSHITSGCAMMASLIDGLLDFSRVSTVKIRRARIDTGTLVRDVFRGLTADGSANGVRFSVGDLPDCWADPILLRQVFSNLVDNALKYSSGREQSIIEVGSLSDDGQVVYFVRDNGVGFDMEYSGKLFGVFQRLHREGEFPGTGVGLAIVANIVRRHGGRIWAEAGVDRGAIFYFTLGSEAVVPVSR